MMEVCHHDILDQSRIIDPKTGISAFIMDTKPVIKDDIRTEDSQKGHDYGKIWPVFLVPLVDIQIVINKRFPAGIDIKLIPKEKHRFFRAWNTPKMYAQMHLFLQICANKSLNVSFLYVCNLLCLPTSNIHWEIPVGQADVHEKLSHPLSKCYGT